MAQLICWLWLLSFTILSAARHHGAMLIRSKNAAVEGQGSVVQPTCAPIPDLLQSQEDFSAKLRPESKTCPVEDFSFHVRRAPTDNDYSCSENKPCSNGACCSKASGYCGYGPDSCGTNGQSPNDKCWSNCDAHAECGRYAKKPGQKCPLNVCCSQFGFCGMTEEFCAKTNNPNTTCQSNCDQPGSGGSGGNVQNRIIGYYEAWNWNKKCIGMRIQDIPVGSITHLHFSFGYISPGSFEIAPMDDLRPSLFSDLTAMKKQNSALKTIVALGGWTFNDNGTTTQPVFSDLVSSPANRAKFISNLLAFLRNYAFDGVDFDWEYPGASDRGGNENDGENFTQLLKELQDAIAAGPTRYIVTFTAPTSYWYLRHFDIKASSEHVDWINVMSYDLHGIWDEKNPIGSHVLAHTNLTEIRDALDLLWRNDIRADKVNLGLGFYGRSFQLADSSCSQPGCLFKGGASPGICTDKSGTLSYREIMDIIDKYSLTPYYDKKNAVKYITWNSDQWVSFDDQETFQQKIKFANNIGLGGLLIWAVDLDTPNLDALQGVIYPKKLGTFAAEASSVDDWEDAAGGDCRVTDCGVINCLPGESLITVQPCEEPDFWTGEALSSALCCPLSAAPDPEKCTWRGNGAWCNGQCHPGEVALESSVWGDQPLYCSDGRKFFCCEAEQQIPNCRWTDCGETCDTSKENKLTWAYQDCWDEPKEFCCDKSEEWKNCAWHGKPGSCFDNHCDTGHQVALTTSSDGEGDDCGWRLERQRSFCCDPPDGKSPFLPVPLDYLFPNPPPEETADTDFKLKVDPTYGGAVDVPFSDDPEDAAFGFFVLTSPEELQVSLDKRDGSHWEVFDCFDAVSENEQTVRMLCADNSENSNCHKIHLGHGVPGTIIEMPKGCGPGKYAVAKSFKISEDQSLPKHLTKRGLTADSPIFDLTFDYDFRRVPRDLGDTQMRLDYSNEPGYWDKVVNKAAGTKRKRSLEDLGGSHRRWLEEAWREDHHGGALSREELHKRWFGSDIIDWLKGIIDGVSGGPIVSNTYKDDFTVLLVDEKLTCPNLAAKLQIKAETHVDVDTNFGLTLISTLAFPPDLSKSYLYFRNKGDVTAKFIVDGAITASFDTDDILLFSADRFGAAFAVPGILTVGPNFKLFGRLEGAATLGVNFQSQVKLASWDINQTFPDANRDWDPSATKSPDKAGTQELLAPTFEYGLTLKGFITAHVKPTITFGIDFNKNFLSVDSCAVNLVADGYITFHADARTGSGGTSFCYGVDAGADLYATVEAPKAFSWALPSSPFQLLPIDPVQIYPRDTDGPACITPRPKRSVAEWDSLSNSTESAHYGRPYGSSQYGALGSSSRLSKRAQIWGPLLPKLLGLSCPGQLTDTGPVVSCPICGTDDDASTASKHRREGESCYYAGSSGEPRCPSSISARDLSTDSFIRNASDVLLSRSEHSSLVKRTTKYEAWNYYGGTANMNAGPYPSCGEASKKSVAKWYGFSDPKAGCTVAIEKLSLRDKIDPSDYVTDHVYEAQTLIQFLNFLRKGPLPAGYTRATDKWVSGALMELPGGGNAVPVSSSTCLWYEMTKSLGGSGGGGEGRLALLYEPINIKKGAFFRLATGLGEVESTNRASRILQRNTAGVFTYMNDNNIWAKFTETSLLVEQDLQIFDTTYAWGNQSGELGRPNRTNAGLRDLYCYFIDQYLGTIEANAGNWATRARTQYDGRYSKDNAGINWLNTELNAQSAQYGHVTPQKMKFPRNATVHAAPGANKEWANSNYNAWSPNLGLAGPF